MSFYSFSFCSLQRSLFLILCLVSCSPNRKTSASAETTQAASGQVLAQVNQVMVTEGQVRARLRDQGAMDSYFRTPEGLRELIEDEVRFEILVEAARREGLASDPEVQNAQRRAMVHRLVEREIALGAEPSAERVQTYYDQHKYDFVQPAKRHIAHIELAKTVAKAAPARHLLKGLMVSRCLEVSFREAAKRFSRDELSRTKGGEEPFLTQAALGLRLGAALADVAFRAPVPSLWPEVVEGPESYQILRVVAERPPILRSFEEARAPIFERLALKERSERFAALVESLRQTQRVVFDEQAIAKLIALQGE